MLTAEQIAARVNYLSASEVACLMTGDQPKIMNLWYGKVGDPRFVVDDLSNVWAVLLGSWTEPLNLNRYEYKTGHKVIRRGEHVVSPHAPWAACTLDGWDEELRCPVEAKHVGGREPLARIVDRYQPQLHWQMLVCNAEQAILSVIEGANEPVCETVRCDLPYAAELRERAEEFWACVENLVPPFAVPPAAPPIRAERIVDMTGDNEFADNAAIWLNNYVAKEKAAIAEKALKSKVPADATKCFAYGVVITRNRAGSLSLRTGGHP
jgi:hypothetical protein